MEVLRSPPEVPYPVILPDFFLDHFVVAGTLNELFEDMKRLAEQGGGNLLGTSQFIVRGGNSVNTAAALLSLGVSPKLIVRTDPQGALLLKSLVNPDLDLSHVHDDGQLSATVSMEVEYEGRRVNLMISDSGSAADFSFSHLSSEDLDVIKGSGLVALLCLNHNIGAVDLAIDLFSFTRNAGDILTFLDLGDPSGNAGIVEPLSRSVLSEGLVDIVGMNENEAGWFAAALSGHDDKWRNMSDPDKWLAAAELISRETGVRVDLHTQSFSACVQNDEVVTVPAFDVISHVICGSGDAWNAGNIYGTLLDLPSKDRLILANAVAALYVSSPTATHPTLDAVSAFLQIGIPF